MIKLIVKVILLVSVFLYIGCNVKSNRNSIFPVKEIAKFSNDEIFNSAASDEQKCELFIKTLKTDGYIQSNGKVNHDYNIDGISEVINDTPKDISDEIPNLEIFYISDSWHCFLMYNKKYIGLTVSEDIIRNYVLGIMMAMEKKILFIFTHTVLAFPISV